MSKERKKKNKRNRLLL
uniref:Uncharacterized protein n=1 Tax=Arundo donax TaxID=35708 RepID=A0A0A9A7I9_ARUDO